MNCSALPPRSMGLGTRFGRGGKRGSPWGWSTYRPIAEPGKNTRLRSPPPVRESSASPTRALSSILTPATSAVHAGTARHREKMRRRSSLKAIFNPVPAERGARAARRMALHVHRDRVHGDVRRRGLHVNGEGG